MNRKDLKYLPHRLWNKLDTIRWNLYHFPINLWKFRKAIWNFRNFDFCGLLELIEVATKEMANCHKNYGITEGSEDRAKELYRVSELANRIRMDNYFEKEGYNKENWDKYSDEEKYTIARKSEDNRNLDVKEFAKLFEKIEYWWD